MSPDKAPLLTINNLVKRFGGFRALDGLSLSIAPAEVSVAERLFAALADGGQVEMPLSKTFWSPCFGMVTDRFGVAWMVTAES